jgi:hypothetical protein
MLAPRATSSLAGTRADVLEYKRRIFSLSLFRRFDVTVAKE